jgi:hypothetical protein
MERDISLDVLRGIMLIIMATDHFGEPVEKYTWEMFGFVSAAEGFVFLSGILVGVVYSRYLASGEGVMEKRIWHRAGTIYLYHLLTFLAVWFFTIASANSGAYWKSYAVAIVDEPVMSIISGLFLFYLPPMLDILPLYVLLLLFAPFSLRLFQQNKAWLVLGGSVVIWLLAQYDIHRFLLAQFPNDWLIKRGAFDPFGWQLIFVLGTFVGFQRYQNAYQSKSINRPLLFLAIITVVFLFLLRHGIVKTGWLEQYSHTDRESIAWLRLLNFLAVVYVIKGIIVAQQTFGLLNLFKSLGRWLAFLGQHSLQVFAYHLVILYLYIPFRWGELALSNPQKVLVLFIFLASLSVPAWLHARYQKRGVKEGSQ